LLALCNIVAAIQFLQFFTKMERTSWYYRPLKIMQVIISLLAILVLLPIPYHEQHLRIQTMVFLRVVAGLAFVTIVMMLVYLVRKALAKSREALIYLLAMFVFSGCAAAEALYHLGVVVLPVYFEHYGMFTGIVLEMIIITFGLASRFNSYRKEREVLLVQMNAQQKRLTDTIIEVQENERKVLADQLHDELGSMLSLASLNISALPHDEKTDQAAGVLQLVTHTVRNISHQLTPVAIEKYGFRHAVEDLVRMANTSGKISIELVLIGFAQQHSYSVNFRNTLYRIVQELLQNVIKHAAASHALVQVVEHDDTVGLLVEDNGRGMDTSLQEHQGPAFMRSIQSKVDYLEGKISIESADGRGTLVNIEIPLPEKPIT
jgi:signal transduction histidine kinase